MPHIRTNLRRAREDRHLTQQQLADELGYDRSYLSQLENCLRNPNRTNAKRIASFFNLSDIHLFDEGIVPKESDASGGDHPDP